MIIIMKNLRQRIVTSIVGAGIVSGSLIGLGGCGPNKPVYTLEEQIAQKKAERSAAFYAAEQEQKRRVAQQEAERSAAFYAAEQEQKRIILQEQQATQNNFQNSQKSDFEKDLENAATRGVGNFIGDVLFYEYLK